MVFDRRVPRRRACSFSCFPKKRNQKKGNPHPRPCGLPCAAQSRGAAAELAPCGGSNSPRRRPPARLALLGGGGRGRAQWVAICHIIWKFFFKPYGAYMSNTKLTEYQIRTLKPLEEKLRKAVQQSEVDLAIELATRIQALFEHDRRHHRLLRAKLWAFEACLDANRMPYAESGFIGIRKLSGTTTRLYLEASSLLAVCYLRQKKKSEAKKLISEVISKINNILSDRTRHQFQKRFIERVEEECILSELIGVGDASLDAKEVEDKAIFLIKGSSDDDILKLIGNSVPVSGVQLLSDVRDYSIRQLPAPDRKLLPAPEVAANPKNVGRTTFAILRRIAWKTFCKPSSPIYKLWSNRVPKVFNEGYFSAAIVSAFGDFKIGLPMIASGILALIMKYSAEEFCDISKPKGLMIGRDEK